MVDTSQIAGAPIEVSLPDFFPQQNLVVEREEHTFDVFQKNNSVEPKTAYQLTKAPVDEIIRVTGIYESSTIEFTKGTDYTLSSDKTEILWDEDERTPVAGTTFFVTYESDSILKRYLAASNDEIEITQGAVVDSITSKFIDTASGDDLDRIGELFGDVIGARRGRVDSDYRAYLKSVVQSFVSRGTIDGIKIAISAATGADIETISIQENFDENTYEVSVIPETPIAGSTIEEIAEIADPSGVEQSLTRFTADEDSVGADDSVFIKDGIAITDTSGSTDDATVGLNTTAVADTTVSGDNILLDPNTTEASEETITGDSVERVSARGKNSFVWDEEAGIYGDGWNFSEWAE